LCYEAKNSFLACEGVEQEEKTLRVSNLLKDWKVDVICFQETKLHSLSRYVVRSLWRCNHIDWCTLDSSGASGGILIMWDTRVVEKVDECVEEFTLAVFVKNIADNFAWAFAGVYGPNSGSDRRRLWDELAGICSWWDSLWCIGGDFNVTRFPSEI
jgi:exonuclease III